MSKKSWIIGLILICVSFIFVIIRSGNINADEIFAEQGSDGVVDEEITKGDDINKEDMNDKNMGEEDIRQEETNEKDMSREDINKEDMDEVGVTKEISAHTQSQKVIALMYHHILDESENQLYKGNGAVVSLEAFKQQMAYLNEKGYNTITMKELEEFLYYKRPLPKSKSNVSVLLTFDDGYLSNYVYAYPILKQYGFKGTVFSVTTNIPDESVHIMDPDKLERISLEQMEETKDVFDFESHTHAFHSKDENNVVNLLSKSRKEAIEDLTQSKEKLGHTVYFNYPYGEYDGGTIEMLKELGFKLAVTTAEGVITYETNPYEIPRYGVFPWTSLKHFKKIFDL